MTRQLSALILAVGALAAAPLAAQAPAATRGTLFIGGGGPQPAALVQEFVDLAGGRGKARIAVAIYDARPAVVTPAGQVLGASGMRMHVLPAGSMFDPRSGTSVLGARPQ